MTRCNTGGSGSRGGSVVAPISARGTHKRTHMQEAQACIHANTHRRHTNTEREETQQSHNQSHSLLLLCTKYAHTFGMQVRQRRRHGGQVGSSGCAAVKPVGATVQHAAKTACATQTHTRPPTITTTRCVGPRERLLELLHVCAQHAQYSGTAFALYRPLSAKEQQPRKSAAAVSVSQPPMQA
jgi:hypothetical protein